MRRHVMTVAALALLALTAALQLAAQSGGSVAGKITDEDGKPVIGATIRLEGTSIGAKARTDGTYLIANIPPGEYSLKVTSVGFQPFSRRITVSAGQITNVDARMTTRAVQGKSIAVIASPVKAENVGTVHTRSVDRYESSTRTSVVNSVTTTEGANGFALRGGRASPSIHTDGVEVADPFTGGYGTTASNVYPTVSTLAVQEVRIQSSGFDAEYGDIQSGSVNTLVGQAENTAKPAAAASTPVNTVDVHSSVTEAQTPAARQAPILENRFIETSGEQMSTFGIDVDAASYTYMRRVVGAGARPDRTSVRIEEFINYFTYDYPEPTGEDPFSITTEVAACPWNAAHKLVSIAVQGRHIDMANVPPSNLVFLIDVSGSMQTPDRLPLLKQAFERLTAQLRAQDTVAIVVYAGAAGMVLPPTSGADKEAIYKALTGLQAGGSTAGGAGITLAYDVAMKLKRPGANTRVILATDGDFNVGISDRSDLIALIEKKREDGVFLTALGVGMGNFRDNTLEVLADNGNGSYAYLDELAEAERVLVEEIGGTLLTIAKDVKIQVEFNPATVKTYRLIGYENRVLANEDFANDRKDAGDLGAGHRVTALYEIETLHDAPSRSDAPKLSDAATRYLPARIDAEPRLAAELLDVRLRYKQPDGTTSMLLEHPVASAVTTIETASENFRFAAAVAEFGLLLRDSQYKGAASYESVLALARGARGNDAGGRRGEFVALVERCGSLGTAR